jgi:hypothetical protein
MNPYIEASGRWPGFHNAMITYSSKLLNAVLPPNYANFAMMRGDGRRFVIECRRHGKPIPRR